MKKIYLLLFISILYTTCQSCRSRQQTDGRTVDSTAIASDSAPAASDISITGRLTELGLTANSDWRGINLGDDFSKLKAIEKGESFENDAHHVGYTVELKNLETADMLYYQTNQKISNIDVDLFLNSRESVTNFQKDLQAYFTARYGTPKSGNGGTIWSGQRGAMVTLKDVSKGKDFGLKINITPSGALTASAK